MVFLLNIFDSWLLLGKCFFKILKNIFPMFVLTFNEKGGLNQMIFLFRLTLLSVFVSFVFSWIRFALKPLFFKASSYKDFASLKILSLQDVSEIRLLIDFGSSFKILGGVVRVDVYVNWFVVWFTIWFIGVIC